MGWDLPWQGKGHSRRRVPRKMTLKKIYWGFAFHTESLCQDLVSLCFISGTQRLRKHQKQGTKWFFNLFDLHNLHHLVRQSPDWMARVWVVNPLWWTPGRKALPTGTPIEKVSHEVNKTWKSKCGSIMVNLSSKSWYRFWTSYCMVWFFKIKLPCTAPGSKWDLCGGHWTVRNVDRK